LGLRRWGCVAALAHPEYLASNTRDLTPNTYFRRARIQSPPGNSRMSDANARHKAEGHYYAALDLMAEGHLEKAVAAYQESLTADPTFTEAMHGLARALQDLERYDEAIAVAQRIAEIDPDDVLAHTSLSVLYQKKGMIAEAEAEGAKARVLGWKQQLKKG
jgi:Flp pilus assembly protein TadD